MVKEGDGLYGLQTMNLKNLGLTNQDSWNVTSRIEISLLFCRWPDTAHQILTAGEGRRDSSREDTGHRFSLYFAAAILGLRR